LLHVQIGYLLLQCRFVHTECDLKIEWVDDVQDVALVDELVVGNSQIPDLTGDLRRHTCNMNSHSPIPCPGPGIVLIPGHESDRHRNDRDPGCCYLAQHEPHGSEGVASPPCISLSRGRDDRSVAWRTFRCSSRSVVNLAGLASRCIIDSWWRARHHCLHLVLLNSLVMNGRIHGHLL
jgi:hypothetical protein